MNENTTFTWIDPFTAESLTVTSKEPVAFEAEAVAAAMGEIDEDLAGLPPGEGAGFDLMFFAAEDGGNAAAFVLRTRGLAPGQQLLLAGRVERFVA